MKQNTNLVIGNNLFVRNDIATLISYVTKKKKFVLVLSMLHDGNEIDEETGSADNWL